MVDPTPHLLRRAFHLASPVFLVYYLIPEDLGVGVTRLSLVLFMASCVVGIEATRIALRIPIFGLRGYEAERVSAYAWGGLGLALAVLVFPPAFVVACFVGMAWIDPLCAFARKRGVYPVAPLVAWIAIFVIVAVALGRADGWPLVLVGAPVALAAEYPNLKHVDDDFLMFMAPLVAVTAVAWLLENL